MLALVELAQRAAGPGQEHRAEPVELNPPSAAVEERDAEFGLEARDGPAQRGLGDAQLGRGPDLVVIMALNGLGVGSVYAVNPLQITGGVSRVAETGSAISFYQLVRTVAYAIASALSATLLVLSTPAGQRFPADDGYSAAALVSIAVLFAALAVSVMFVMRRPEPGREGA